MQDINATEIVSQRLARNGLSVPFTQPLACARALAGIQSQFQQWAEVSIMNRCSPGLTMRDLLDLYSRHDIINLWGQRQTLHMYAKEDWDTVSHLYEPVVSAKKYANNRFIDDFAHLMDRMTDACAESHPLSKAAILAMVEDHMADRHSERDYVAYTLIILGCLRGIFFGLPEKPGITTFIGRNRIGALPWQKDEQRASRALESYLLRYFQYYGPATLADFSHWSGLPQGTAKRCMSALTDSLTTYSFGGRHYFTYGQPEGEPAGDGVLLLGKFDPLFVSYRHKDWIIPDKLQKQVWRKAGWVEAVILDGATAVGTWRHSLKGRKMSLEVSQFTKIKAASRKKLQTKAERLAEFWEKQLETVTFS